MTTQLQNTEPLLAFRLAYLRAIARSWQDDAYRRDLLGQRDIQPMLHRDFSLPTQWPQVDVSLRLLQRDLAFLLQPIVAAMTHSRALALESSKRFRVRLGFGSRDVGVESARPRDAGIGRIAGRCGQSRRSCDRSRGSDSDTYGPATQAHLRPLNRRRARFGF